MSDNVFSSDGESDKGKSHLGNNNFNWWFSLVKSYTIIYTV